MQEGNCARIQAYQVIEQYLASDCRVLLSVLLGSISPVRASVRACYCASERVIVRAVHEIFSFDSPKPFTKSNPRLFEGRQPRVLRHGRDHTAGPTQEGQSRRHAETKRQQQQQQQQRQQ